jgi:hypothetical protein
MKYPLHPENNVTYTYGSATDNSGFNRKGRLVMQEDGSGRQEFKYGRQGELTEVSRTLVIPNQAVATYTTRWDYDSWNRLWGMTYPDGEVVNYSYNTGGLLKRVVGGKAGESTIYVDSIRYDKFEQRSYIKYGNGTETNYSYNPQNRLLDILSVQKGSTMLINNLYDYDAVHNVTGVVNTGVPGNTIGGA